MAKPNLFYSRPRETDRRGGVNRLTLRWGFCGLMLVSALSGCRHIDNAQVDVLESELRKQEDYIYELEGYLMEYSEKLRQARAMQCETVVSKSTERSASSKEPTLDVGSVKRPTLPMNGREKLAPRPESSLPAPPATTEAPRAGAEGAPGVETAPIPEVEEISPDEMEAPALEIGPGVQALPQPRAYQSVDARRDDRRSPEPLLIPDPIDYQTESDSLAAATPIPILAPEPAAIEESPAEPLLAAPQLPVERLTADHLKIRRVFAERPSPEDDSISSLLIVLEALNATDEPVGADGGASLMIMTQDGASAAGQVVERWDFTAEETAAAWQSSELGDGLHLELPLARTELPAGKLELWARVVGADGRKLLTQIPLEPATLASMQEFDGERELATKELTPVAEPIRSVPPAENQVAVSTITKTVAEESKSAWRPSTARLSESRSDGVAMTAAGPAAGDASNSDGASGKPTWKRSSSTVGAAKPGGTLLR